MAEVLCIYQIPVEQEINPEELDKIIRGSIPDKYTIQGETEVVPLFFGMKALKIQFIIPEEDGAQDELEKLIKENKGVGGELTLEFTTRL